MHGNVLILDNSWVVPYNPFLSLKYNAHINVEVVHSVSAVKYLYKYITKGSDHVMMRLSNGQERDITNDEIESFVNARYISASEAYWRIYEFNIQYKYPPVSKLPLHLQDEQVVLFQPSDAHDVARQGSPVTKLTAYFSLNQTDPEARTILYPDIYKYYQWEHNSWVRRRANRSRMHTMDQLQDDSTTACSDMIGRIPVITLNARQSELYFLRMLLYHKVGATSFQDMRTFEGEVQATYQEVCKKMGLIDDENEIDQVMEEAAPMCFGSQLRYLFTAILIFIRPSNPLTFWQRHTVSFCQDLMHRAGATEPTAEVVNEVLLDIQEFLERSGFALSDFQLPAPDPALIQQCRPREIREETDYDIGALKQALSDNLEKLNEDQQMVFQAVMTSVQHGSSHIIGLDAPGGTGKTFLLSTMLAAVRSEDKVALATATSGIAAILLPNGRTLYSRFKVPLNITDESTCHITKRDNTAELLRRCHLIVIDEVTMAHRHVYEAVDRTLRDIRETDRPFGGITVVLAGDWRQILPIVRKGARPEIVAACLKSSPLWQHVQVMKLSKNMRMLLAGHNSATFADHLLEIGEGRVPVATDVGPHKICLKEDFAFAGDSLTQLCNQSSMTLPQNTVMQNGYAQEQLSVQPTTLLRRGTTS